MDDWETTSDLGALPSPAGQVTGIAVTPLDPRHIYVSTDVGVYSSQDGGATWQAFQTGMPRSIFCTGIRYVESPPGGYDTLVLATFGRGMYETQPLRTGPVYVDQRNTGIENGTRVHPYNTLVEGVNATSFGGTLALNGANTYAVPVVLNTSMVVTSYEGPAIFQ